MKASNYASRLLAATAAAVLLVNLTAAVPQVNGVSTDPGIVAAGDTVTLSVNMRETNYPDKVWDEDTELKAYLEPGNRLAREYSTITDDRDESIGFLYPDGVWNQNYEVRVDSDAPTGEYDYEIQFQYLENGVPVQSNGENLSFTREISFPVEKEGVDLFAQVSETSPENIRPGDNNAQMKVRVTNAGSKPVEEVILTPETPENVTPAYSSDERFFISRLNDGESSTIAFDVKVDEEISPGRKEIKFNSEYEDLDSNTFTEPLIAPLRIEGRPDLELAEASTSMKAGSSSDLRFKVRNTGAQDAEGVTARALLEREQPFTLEDRSVYIGEIESGETAEASLKVSSSRNADLRDHQVRIQLRANGDSTEGDDSVYTFTEQASVGLDGRTTSPLIYLGLAGAIAAVAFIVYRLRGSEDVEEE